jgi:hypothetical protein
VVVDFDSFDEHALHGWLAKRAESIEGEHVQADRPAPPTPGVLGVRGIPNLTFIGTTERIAAIECLLS